MTKKILIDEAVVRQALEALEPLTTNAELRGDSLQEGNELHRMADAGFKAITYLREALEVNNKGVNALAEQEPDLSEQGRTRSAILGNNVEAMMDAGLPFLTALETALKVYCHDTPKIGCVNHDCDKFEALAEQQEYWEEQPDGSRIPVDPSEMQPAPTQQPLTDEQMFEMAEIAWRRGWASCRDADYVGEEAEDERWGMVGAEVVQDIAAHGITGSKEGGAA